VSASTARVLAVSVSALFAASGWSHSIAATSREIARGGPITVGYSYAAQCPAAGVAKRVDRWDMFMCNCTSYVAWALQANGQRIDWFVRGAMDARNWPNVARRAGLRIVHTPAVGDVAVWPALGKPFGHVAYVTAVAGNGRFVVGEYNFPSPGGLTRFVFDLRTTVVTRGVAFIAVPRTTIEP
jgi:surface antigen